MSKRTYKMQISVIVDESDRKRLIDTARLYYARSGGVSRIEDGETEEHLTPEEFIESVDDALMELIHLHPSLEEAGIELGEITCDAEEQDFSLAPAADPENDFDEGAMADTEGEEIEDEPEEIDEFETGVYLCRWANGDCSVVTAASRRAAILALDEWGGADPSQLYALDSFMADFRLNDGGEIQLVDFGEECRADIWEICYPELDKILSGDHLYDSGGKLTPDALEQVRKATEYERTRLWDNQPKDQPSTEMGKQIAKQMGTSAVVADHYVKLRAKKILKSVHFKEGKPN